MKTEKVSLHPDILFHFTGKKALYEILKSTFKLSYARETIIGPNNRRELGVPMISFCDLKLSELKYFLSYGNFGIGLSKAWANRHGLSPVMYINRHSKLMDDYIVGVTGVYQHLEEVDDYDQNLTLGKNYMRILNSYRYIKNYEGELWRRGKLKDGNYRFADEREWRFVPNIENERIPAFVPIEKIRTSAQKTKFNKMVQDERLTFQPDDIKYLIVKSESDIVDLIHHLECVKGRFDQDTRRRLASRILTVDQIKKDI